MSLIDRIRPFIVIRIQGTDSWAVCRWSASSFIPLVAFEDREVAAGCAELLEERHPTGDPAALAHP